MTTSTITLLLPTDRSVAGPKLVYAAAGATGGQLAVDYDYEYDDGRIESTALVFEEVLVFEWREEACERADDIVSPHEVRILQESTMLTDVLCLWKKAVVSAKSVRPAIPGIGHATPGPSGWRNAGRYLGPIWQIINLGQELGCLRDCLNNYKCENGGVVMACPDGFGNMLSGSMTSIWATIWLADGIGWLLISRHATNPSRFARVGIAASAAGALWLIAGCLFRYVSWEISYTMLAVSWVLILAGMLRYFVWSENWQPIRRIISDIGDDGIRYDVPEVIVLAIVWLISLSSIGKGVFVGASLIFWNIVGGVSTVRMFDLPAAVGIGATPIARSIFLWFARISLVVAIVLKLMM